MICPTGEAKYFCKGDSTEELKMRPTGKSRMDPMTHLALFRRLPFRI
jgi:hypothetical protein